LGFGGGKRNTCASSPGGVNPELKNNTRKKGHQAPERGVWGGKGERRDTNPVSKGELGGKGGVLRENVSRGEDHNKGPTRGGNLQRYGKKGTPTEEKTPLIMNREEGWGEL